MVLNGANIMLRIKKRTSIIIRSSENADDNGGLRETNEAALLTPQWIQSDWITCNRVTIIGRDPFAATGLRYLLARQGSVRLTFLHDIAELENDLDSSELLIWIRVRDDGLPELAGTVAKLSRLFPKLKQLVISDSLPIKQPAGQTILSGVWQACARESVNILYRLLIYVLTCERRSEPLMRRRLGRMQSKVLFMRAEGVDARTIAKVCGIAVKTVRAHESMIKKRMYIINHKEYAWLLRSCLLLKQELPGIERIISRRHQFTST